MRLTNTGFLSLAGKEDFIVAYVVCQHFGIDTSDYSFGYVAGWSKGKDLDELKSSLDTIRSCAAGLIDAIESKCPSLQPKKEPTQSFSER